MSLGVIIKCPEGLVLAAESRVTVTQRTPNGVTIQNNFDNAKKLIAFGGVHKFIGAITYGLGSIKNRTAHSFMPEFESTLPNERIKVDEFSQRMSDFFMNQWDNEGMPPQENFTNTPMVFLVSGFDPDQAYGTVYQFIIPTAPTPSCISVVNNFGINWGGQTEIMNRLVNGFDPSVLKVITEVFKPNAQQINELSRELTKIQIQTPYPLLALQDCIDLAEFYINTTINAQEFSLGTRGCGGNVDIAVITRIDGIQQIKWKKLTAKS